MYNLRENSILYICEHKKCTIPEDALYFGREYYDLNHNTLFTGMRNISFILFFFAFHAFLFRPENFF